MESEIILVGVCLGLSKGPSFGFDGSDLGGVSQPRMM